MAMIKKTIKCRKAYAIDDEIMYDNFSTCDFSYNDDEEYLLKKYHEFLENWKGYEYGEYSLEQYLNSHWFWDDLIVFEDNYDDNPHDAYISCSAANYYRNVMLKKLEK